MTGQQIELFALLGAVFAFLIWGRWRYDLVAFSALVVALVTGIVPVEQAFTGFGHPATIVIALVLILSRALSNSGAIELMARYLLSTSRTLSVHIGLTAGVAAALSAVINNVAALALLMPLDIQAAAKAKRSPALTLMPLSFATIFGGMITLIGTPPNIIIAEARNRALGAPFAMFDFAPVGAACAVVGVAFVSFVGWRLLPRERGQHDSAEELMDLKGYVAEVQCRRRFGCHRQTRQRPRRSRGRTRGLDRRCGAQGERMPGTGRRVSLRKDDRLVIEASPNAIESLVGALGLEVPARAGRRNQSSGQGSYADRGRRPRRGAGRGEIGDVVAHSRQPRRYFAWGVTPGA